MHSSFFFFFFFIRINLDKKKNNAFQTTINTTDERAVTFIFLEQISRNEHVVGICETALSGSKSHVEIMVEERFIQSFKFCKPSFLKDKILQRTTFPFGVKLHYVLETNYQHHIFLGCQFF